MTVETRFLASIEHPNIVKMRAYSSCDPFHPDYFIVMDRLYDTLEVRIQKWAKVQKRMSGRGRLLVSKKKREEESSLWEDRLVAAFDLSAAFAYLHSLNVIYRDCKPENIGFDVRGDIKLFDFGLAKEVDPTKSDPNGAHRLTGKTGSQRYMAPEVALSKPYGTGCDVYSFALVFWEMLALTEPYAGMDINAHLNLVVKRGVRPRVDASWPPRLRVLLERGWNESAKDRPPMASATNILRGEVARARDGDQTGLEHCRRRSTFVLRKGSFSFAKSNAKL